MNNSLKKHILLIKLTFLAILIFSITTVIHYLWIVNLNNQLRSSFLTTLSIGASLFTPIAAYLIYTNWKQQDKYIRILNLFEDFIKSLNELHTAIFLIKHKRFLIIEQEFLNQDPPPSELNKYLNKKLNHYIDHVHTIYPYLFKSTGLMRVLKFHIADFPKEFDTLIDEYHEILQKLPIFYKDYLEQKHVIIKNNFDENNYSQTYLYTCRKAQICIYHSFDSNNQKKPIIATNEHLMLLNKKREELVQKFTIVIKDL